MPLLTPLSPFKCLKNQWKYNRLTSSSPPDPEQQEREKVTAQHETFDNSTYDLDTYSNSNLTSWMRGKVGAFSGFVRSGSFRIEGNVTPWIFSTLFFAFLVMVISVGGEKKGGKGCGGGREEVSVGRVGCRWGDCEGGEQTEMERTDRILGIPKTTITSIPFTGSPSFDSHGFISMAPESPPYTGEPSPEIDEAWEALKGGRYFAITEEEAKQLWGDGYMEFEDKTFGGFTAGLDIFHGLHCINQIRMTLHPDSYSPPSRLHGPAHLAHCLTHLRQLIQCSGDTTPNPTKYYQGIRQNYVHVDRVHSCRDWEAIRQWGWERYNGTLMVEREREGMEEKIEY